MNSNIVAYIIYLVLMVYIIYWLGRLFHRSGRVFILQLYKGDTASTDTTNNILLIAYYLFNMGYAFLKLRSWERIRSPAQLIDSLSGNIGILILILAVTHYFNMLLIYFLAQKHKTITP
ncbi:hypothetical protein [Taibaiella chishuiensis]|uniref:Uncharacterized protein n=1 Tax=Taibaiella chishuiensis TaxID=1434707 RepID=A0A2P8D837_9BACT|nr:hypothetical protein [Taibaiella chishuiensis]PSK93359.1 hypothetical protein B0I18_102329 [Taibaiella chishuiensis]